MESLDVEASIARSLSLISAMRLTIAPSSVDELREAEVAQVREVWNTLRRAHGR